MATTRKKNTQWLLNKCSTQELSGARLTSQEDVLLLFHYHKDQGLNVDRSKTLTTDAAMQVYKRASISAMEARNAKVKMNKLLDRYNKLKKSMNHTTDGIKMNRDIFLSDIEEIFDIACKSEPLLPDDQAFLASQGENRMFSSISSRDSKFEKATSEKLKRKAQEQKRESKNQREMAELSATIQPTSTDD